MACDNPTWIKPKGVDMPVPCGKCAPCKIRRVNEWVFRLMWEEEHNSTSSHFITLTYDTTHVPITKNGFMTLVKKDFQDYMKRLRKLADNEKRLPLKYYAVGEYGAKKQRPHYHAIIFNCENPDWYSDAWGLNGVQFGDVLVGTCTTDSVAYCMKYIDKPKEKKWRHGRDDRAPEFALMSKGLGSGYFEDPAIRAYHKADLSRNYVTKLGGYRVAMPRYYRQKIYNELELDAQRAIIEQNICDADISARLYHDASSRSWSYIEQLEFEKEGRAFKFANSIKKRTAF